MVNSDGLNAKNKWTCFKPQFLPSLHTLYLIFHVILLKFHSCLYTISFLSSSSHHLHPISLTPDGLQNFALSLDSFYFLYIISFMFISSVSSARSFSQRQVYWQVCQSRSKQEMDAQQIITIQAGFIYKVAIIQGWMWYGRNHCFWWHRNPRQAAEKIVPLKGTRGTGGYGGAAASIKGGSHPGVNSERGCTGVNSTLISVSCFPPSSC